MIAAQALSFADANARDAREVAHRLGLTPATGGGVPLEGGRKFPRQWCASSDAMHAYPNGRVHCFSCGHDASNVDLVMQVRGVSAAQACAEVLGAHVLPARTGTLRLGDEVASYQYRDAAGAVRYEVVRFANPKAFRQRRPDGRGGHVWTVKGVELVPYRLPEALEAVAEERLLWVPEGEKDVDRLIAIGLAATTNPGGAGKWRDSYAAHFGGASVAVLADNDDPGRSHAQQVASSCHAAGCTVHVVDLPGLPPKGDVSDWLDAGGTRDELEAILARTPVWHPDAPAARSGGEFGGALVAFVASVARRGSAVIARDVLERIEAADVAVWLAADGAVHYDDPAGAFVGELRADRVAALPALAALLGRVPCRAGYTRGSGVWRAVFATGRGYARACRRTWTPPALTRRLSRPEPQPPQRLCQHCVRALVERELALLDAERECV
jgi:hypothetical protein